MEHEDVYQKTQRPKYDCLLFDLDDTLYPLSSGIAAECSKNIRDYMHEKLGIEETKVPDLCALLYQKYGTTMAGLRAIGYDFDYDDYHRFNLILLIFFLSFYYHNISDKMVVLILCALIVLFMEDYHMRS
ncbi:Haloacid dehalogenase-like hydrolase [Canna indica]|uniref:Haloacid dehalogenase-like hydrolase n=1 Tax=Canna indica TaxID=4628 RepID=A0AAQ3KCL7_9LILI|nr:Haloacid dehalogenase-like hydrolase [Canna indica]